MIYEEKADPGTTSFVPRPDWYFYFLFYLLRIFKWPDSVVLGTVGIPTIALILLIALPFLDRRHGAAAAAPARRDGGACVLTVDRDGSPHLQGRDRGGGRRRRCRGGRPLDRGEPPQRGRPRRARSSSPPPAACNCHTYSGAGASNLGAPDLTDIGAQQGKDAAYLQRYIADPSEFGNNVMPKFESLGEENLTAHLPSSSPPPRAAVRASGAPCASSSGSQAPRARRMPHACSSALAAADCEVGICASGSGIEVIATELYGDARLSRDEVLARFTEACGRRCDPLRRARLALALRERLGARRRLRDLPLLDEHARDDRVRARCRT